MSVRRSILGALLTGTVALAAAAPGRADHPGAACGPVKVDAVFQFRCDIKTGYAQFHLGPWYAYFPYDAHFQMQAPYGGPSYWPMQMPLYGQGFAPGHGAWPHAGQVPPPAGAPGQASPTMPPGQQTPPMPPMQPVGYIGPAPSYWYR